MHFPLTPSDLLCLIFKKNVVTLLENQDIPLTVDDMYQLNSLAWYIHYKCADPNCTACGDSPKGLEGHFKVVKSNGNAKDTEQPVFTLYSGKK